MPQHFLLRHILQESEKSMFTTLAFMAFAMLAAALVVLAVITTAFRVTILTITVAATTARASAHLLLHAVCNFLVSGSFTLFNSKAKVLINSGQKLIKLLASLQETTASVIFNHILTQGIKLGNFLL